MARLIETDNFTNKDISAAVSIGSYTATAVRLVHVRVLVNQAAGNGDYIIYATITKSAVEYRVIPTTTAAAASGLTSLAFVSLAIPVDVSDVLQVYIDGLAGDTATPDTQVDFYEKDYLRPTVAGRTLDVNSDGEAGVDWANVGGKTSTVALTNTSLNSVSGSVGSIATGGITAASFAAGAIDAAAIAADAIGSSELATSAVTEIAAAVSGTTGSGAISYTFTVNDGANPIDGVEVWVSTNITSANVVAGTLSTSALGTVTFMLDAGTYYAWLQRAGYNFTNPTAFTVS